MRLLLLVLVLLGSAAGFAGASARPTLTLRERAPLVVQGTHFAAGERVVVTAITGLGPRRTTVRALNGRFVARFSLPAEGCGAVYAVRAVGSSGSKATLVLGKAPVCVPPPRD